MRRKKTEEPAQETMTGILRMHPKGFGFVIPDHPALHPQDIFIPKHLTQHAVDSDHVEVQIKLDSFSEKGPEGKIVGVLKRGRKHLAGIVREISPSGECKVYAPILGISKPVLTQPFLEGPIVLGDRVTLEVEQWGSATDATLAHIVEIIGNIADPSCDVPAAIEEFDLCSLFPKAAIQQAKKYKKEVPKKDYKGRVDLTELETVTIDPDTAKDFDDALSLTQDRKGNYHLAVHIADVAHYVKEGTPLDSEALERCNSTYFPGTCIPMLPEELSNELCSLKPEVVRLTVSVLMDFDRQGTLFSQKVARSFIRSDKRFSYLEAKEVLDGKRKSPHLKMLRLMEKLCLLLKAKRRERGSIDFSLTEMALMVDAKGVPTGVQKIPYDITHQLVEEFMLKANEIVAQELSRREKPLLFRVHEEPSQENFQDFFALARSLGFSLPPKPTQQDLQNLFEQVKESPFGQQLSIAFIRSMKLAQYSPENMGHFGLALEYYCHFTSPIRRYSDLIIQRQLFDELPEECDLHAIALKCSEQERVSFKAESSVKTLKKLRLLSLYAKENPDRSYEAAVMRIKPFGLFFELDNLGIEGFLHISELDNDYFLYDGERSILTGRKTGKTYRCGDKLLVQLQRVDLILTEAKWTLCSENPRTSPEQKGKSRLKKRRTKK